MNNIPNTLTQADFEAIADYCYRTTSRAVLQGEAVEPVILTGTVRDGKVQVVRLGVVTEIANADNKLAIATAMSELVQQPEIDFAVFISEAWLKRNPTLPLQGRIADDPQRQEAVIFSIMSKECQVVVTNLMHRHPSRLERGSVDFTTQMVGLMVRDAETRN